MNILLPLENKQVYKVETKSLPETHGWLKKLELK